MKRGLIPVALLCMALAGTACRPLDQPGAAGPNTPASSPPAPTRAASATPSQAPSAAPSSGSASPVPSPATGLCAGTDLAVSLGGTSAGAGHRGLAILFRNTGPARCYLRGYPRVVALDAAGRQVARAAQSPRGYLGGLAAGRSIPRVTLAPGGTASAMVEGLAFNGASGRACAAYRGLLVTPPGGTRPTRLTLTGDLCSGLQVHPFVSGRTGRQ